MPPTDDARIGDFSRPMAEPPKPKAPAPAPASPTKEALEAMDAQLETEVSRDEAALKPMASYEERLKEEGIDKKKAAEIIDAVLLKGFYAEDVPLTKTIKARFRTRNARDTRRAQEQIEAQRLSYEVHYNELLSRYLLAASLERFAEDALKHPPKGAKQDDVEKLYADRLAYVDALSDPALRLLLTKLSKFDRMVSVCLAEGSVENF